MKFQVAYRSAALAAALLMMSSIQAACWLADESSGELRFSGQVEGENFFGSFDDFDVRVCRPDGSDWSASEWTVSVATGSADTRNRDRDETLHGRYFFAVEEFPTATWTSTRVIDQGDGLVLEGSLGLKGFTASQSVNAELDSSSDALSLVGSADISRLNFGVGQGEYADTEFIRDRVELEFELRLISQ